MDEEGFATREEVLAAFAELQGAAGGLEKSTAGSAALPVLEKIERSVQSLALFSPNEEFEELDTELQPLILLPYFLALAHSGQHADRLHSLDRADRYFKAFLGLAQHYNLLSELGRRVFARTQQEPGFQIEREDKIALYREEKALASEAESLVAQDNAAKLNANLISSSAVKAVNRLLLLPQERKIVEFGQNLARDPQAREEYERERAKPVPKLDFFRVDKPPPAPTATTAAPVANVVESFEQQRENERVQRIANVHRDNPNNAKLELLATLNQHSHAQPTMTIDQFDELEYSLMKQKEAEGARFKRQKQEFNARMKIEDSDDSENEFVAEAKTYKAREWDNFKDENEKGGGNRQGR